MANEPKKPMQPQPSSKPPAPPAQQQPAKKPMPGPGGPGAKPPGKP
jgi:hypothetical protein